MGEQFKLTEKDRKIINVLVEDSRTSLREIASKVGANIDYVHRRIKTLVQEGVIENFTINVSYPKIGFSHVTFNAIKLTNISSERYDALIKYLLSQYQIIEIAPITGTYDLSITILAKDANELRDITLDVRTKFKDLIQSWETYTVLKYVRSRFQFD